MSMPMPVTADRTMETRPLKPAKTDEAAAKRSSTVHVFAQTAKRFSWDEAEEVGAGIQAHMKKDGASLTKAMQAWATEVLASTDGDSQN